MLSFTTYVTDMILFVCRVVIPTLPSCLVGETSPDVIDKDISSSDEIEINICFKPFKIRNI